ncbi:hypothetical protein [Serratia sp. DD3]|uniref:hypothetical protein n=1 Tax=Serratia sp. DD3 TaxID=1410619 RepID=UPI0004D80F64|nr:hypothetical protein [Serratia sp. DD3]KEY57512.1 hypothetical protein SRDD_34930 [Serratia sp. DD3]
MKKLTAIIISALLLVSLGNTANSASSSGGNFSATQETLSSDNKADIKSDLTDLSRLMKAHNSDVAKIKSELSEAGKKEDADGMIKAFDKVKFSVIELTNQLKALTIKSQELQDIRMDIVTSNDIGIILLDFVKKNIELNKKGQSLSESEVQQMNSLQEKSVTLMKIYGEKLSKLNKEYNIQ